MCVMGAYRRLPRRRGGQARGNHVEEYIGMAGGEAAGRHACRWVRIQPGWEAWR